MVVTAARAMHMRRGCGLYGDGQWLARAHCNGCCVAVRVTMVVVMAAARAVNMGVGGGGGCGVVCMTMVVLAMPMAVSTTGLAIGPRLRV